jgi:hypothetical protein
METISKNSTRRFYNVPIINRIKIDEQISLALESSPPVGPGELVQNNSQSNNPFNICNS